MEEDCEGSESLDRERQIFEKYPVKKQLRQWRFQRSFI